MEVGEEGIDELEVVAGLEEDAGGAGVFVDLAGGGDVFEGAGGGGAYGYYPSAFLFCASKGLGRGWLRGFPG